MSAGGRRLWTARRVDGGVVPPGVGLAMLRRLRRHWPDTVLCAARLAAASMDGAPERAEQLVRVRALQLALLGDALMGVYSLLRDASAEGVRPLLHTVPEDVPEGVDPAALDVMAGVAAEHSHEEAIELCADALLRERAAYEDARRRPTVQLLHAHAIQQALLADALRAQIIAALDCESPDRRRACLVAVRA